MTSALTGSDYPTINESDYSQTIKETIIKIRHPDEEFVFKHIFKKKPRQIWIKCSMHTS